MLFPNILLRSAEPSTTLLHPPYPPSKSYPFSEAQLKLSSPRRHFIDPSSSKYSLPHFSNIYTSITSYHFLFLWVVYISVCLSPSSSQAPRRWGWCFILLQWLVCCHIKGTQGLLKKYWEWLIYRKPSKSTISTPLFPHPISPMAQDVGVSIRRQGQGQGAVSFKRVLHHIPLSLSLSLLPPAPCSVSQKTAPKAPKQGDQIIVGDWHVMAVEGLAPMSAPLLNPMPFSVKQFSFSRLWLHMTSQWALQGQPDRSLHAAWVSSLSRAICCFFQQLPMVFALTTNAFTTLLGSGWKTFHKIESMEARFQRSRTPKWPVLPYKHLLWSQFFPRGPGMVSYVPNCKLQWVKYI